MIKKGAKDKQLLEFMRSNDLIVANTFFKSEMYHTCKSFNSEGSTHQINHIIALMPLKTIIENCKVF